MSDYSWGAPINSSVNFYLGPFSDDDNKDDDSVKAIQAITEEGTQEITQLSTQATVFNLAGDNGGDNNLPSLPLLLTLPRLETPSKTLYKNIMKML